VAGYYLSEEAHADLVGIAVYTAERWGDGRRRSTSGGCTNGSQRWRRTPRWAVRAMTFGLACGAFRKAATSYFSNGLAPSY